MDVIGYIKLGMTGLALIVDLVNAVKSGQAAQPGDQVAQFLGMLGNIGDVKELQGEGVAQVAPFVNDLFSKVHDVVTNIKAKA